MPLGILSTGSSAGFPLATTVGEALVRVTYVYSLSERGVADGLPQSA